MTDQFDMMLERTQSNAEKYQLRDQLFGTEDVIPMWVADMDIQTPSCVTLAVGKRAQHGIYGYEMMSESAFDAQISWMQERHRLHLKREWMFYSPSVVASINVAIKAFTAVGDEVVIQPPVYAPFETSIKNNERKVVKNPLRVDENGMYRFDFDDLKKKITDRTKLLLLCSPHNPVGRVWLKDELQVLAAICLEHNIKVLSDEIHSDLVYAPHRHTPFASLGNAVREMTMTTIGPGKTFNMAGLSISTAAIPNDAMREEFHHIYRSIHFAEGTVFGHVAFQSAYEEGALWLEALKEHLLKNQQKLRNVLEKHADKITCQFPQGTYLAWLDCREMGISDKALRRFFVEKARLGLSPGVTFGKEGKGFMRLNFAVTSDIMDEALRRLEKALENFKPQEYA